jgi:hypothetical protein
MKYRWGRRIAVDIPIRMAAPDASQTSDWATRFFPALRHMHST